MTPANVPVLKDEHAQQPVASVWRPTLRKIVEAFAQSDYSLSKTRIAGVRSIPNEKSQRIERYVSSYGESLVELPEEAWSTSVSQWMGTHWDVLVDLFTRESGESDLVLSMRVFEEPSGGYRYEVDSVHVP